ncbi:MAG: hypothetical protein P8179_21435 [Candidatus Thiodiazotropha sp.]
MILKLSWKNTFESCVPFCETDSLSDKNVDMLANILMDDGGIPYKETISWLDHAIKNSGLVENGEIDSFDWDREAWGAEITKGGVTLHSLLDETYTQMIRLDTFISSLKEWEAFLNTHYSSKTTYEVSV